MDSKFKIDDIDTDIIQLLTAGKNNREISSTVNVALSTIQRRIRNLIISGLVVQNFQISYEHLGLNSGLINIIVANGDINEVAKKVCDLDGVISVEVHIGNFDITGRIVYEDRPDLLNIISNIKKIRGVKSVLWSERIYQITKRNELNLHINDIGEQMRMSM